MLRQTRSLKYKLSHIKEDSWHWNIVSDIWGKNAKGKACTYYWFKLPTAMVMFLVIVVFYVILIFFRALWVFGAWFKGYRFSGNIMDLDDEVSEDFNYLRYKVRHNGTKVKIAPWEPVMTLITMATIFYLGLVNQQLGITLLATIIFLLLLAVILYFLTSSWKSPLIKSARKNVSNFWSNFCPTLVVEGESTDFEN